MFPTRQQWLFLIFRPLHNPASKTIWFFTQQSPTSGWLSGIPSLPPQLANPVGGKRVSIFIQICFVQTTSGSCRSWFYKTHSTVENLACTYKRLCVRVCLNCRGINMKKNSTINPGVRAQPFHVRVSVFGSSWSWGYVLREAVHDAANVSAKCMLLFKHYHCIAIAAARLK